MALAIDSSTPAFASVNSGAAATTASFTPPAGAVLVAVAYHDTTSGNTTNTSLVTDSQGLTWTIQATRNRADVGGQNAHVQVSTAVVASSASMTVTSTGTNTLGPAGLYVLVLTGADTSTPFDDIDEGSNTAGAVSIALTTITDGARGFLAVTDWNVAAAMTAGTDQTAIVSSGIGPGPDVRVFLGRQNAVTSPAGSVTMSTASPTSGNTNNYIAFAVKPSTGGGPTLYTQDVAGAITPAGALVRRTAKSMTGAITPIGALTVLKAALRSFAGGITPTGTLTRQTRKALSGAVAPAGSLRKLTAKTLAGVLLTAGVLVKQTAKRLVGSIGPAGAVTNEQGSTPPPTGTGTPLVTTTFTRWLKTSTFTRWITTSTDDGGDP